jgi:drug/metabolite transporter (DMT)-like permease
LSSHAPHHTRAYAAWIAVCLVWGTTYLGIRIGLETIPPFLMAAFRWTLAGVILLAAFVVRGRPIPGPRAWPSLMALGILLMGFGNGAVVWAQQSVPSGLTSVLVAAAPFWMVGIERLMPDGEPLGAEQLAGLAVGFGGIVLLVWPELQLEGSGAFAAGAAATQVACLGWAIGSSYSRRRSRSEDVLAAAALQMLFAGVVLMLVATVRGEWETLGFGPRTLGALAYLILVGSVIGYSSYAYALKHLPIATVSLYAYVNPVIAMALGALVLGERFTLRIAVAGAIVLLGMAMVRKGSVSFRRRGAH